MSTQIRYRLSGPEEQVFLEAVRKSGLSADAYARARALAPINPADSVLQRIERRLEALENKLSEASPVQSQEGLPSTLVKGMDASELLLAVRRETRAGVSAFLVLLDAEPLPEGGTERRAAPDQSG